MFSYISVLIPTRRRVERLRTLLESFRHTTYGHEAELVFKVDDDDTETLDFLRGYPYTVVVGPRKRGYLDMYDFFNELARFAKGDVLMLGNDDMVFKSMDWPTYLISAANRFPDGVFDLGVTTHNETHYPFATVSKRVVEKLGFVWDPRVFWGDMYLRDIMAHFGRCVMVPEVKIDHDWAGFKPDRTFIEGGDRNPVATDPTYWAVTHRVAVNEAITKLEEMYVHD